MGTRPNTTTTAKNCPGMSAIQSIIRFVSTRISQCAILFLNKAVRRHTKRATCALRSPGNSASTKRLRSATKCHTKHVKCTMRKSVRRFQKKLPKRNPRQDVCGLQKESTKMITAVEFSLNRNFDFHIVNVTYSIYLFIFLK